MMYLIVREKEVAPTIWSSNPVVVDKTSDAETAWKVVDEKNAAEKLKDRSRRLRTRYVVDIEND